MSPSQPSASRMNSMAVFGEEQVAVIGVTKGSGAGKGALGRDLESDASSRPRDVVVIADADEDAEDRTCEVALEVHPRAADIAPGLLCLAHLMHALHNH